MTLQEVVGTRIKEIRNKSGFLKNNFQTYLAFDRTFISHVEKGRRNISLETVEKMAKGLKAHVSKFFMPLKKNGI